MLFETRGFSEDYRREPPTLNRRDVDADLNLHACHENLKEELAVWNKQKVARLQYEFLQ